MAKPEHAMTSSELAGTVLDSVPVYACNWRAWSQSVGLACALVFWE